MSTYTGKPVTVNIPAEAISEKFADLTQFESRMENMPEAYRSRMGNVSFTADSITMRNPQVGAVCFRVVERTAEKVVLQCDSPLPIRLTLNLAAANANSSATTVTTDVDVELPAMLKPFIGPHMQKVADEFSTMMGSLAGS